MPKQKPNLEPNGIDKPIRLLLRDRDTGELVYSGIMNCDGQVELLEVGNGYIDLLRQIGVSVGDA